MARLVLDHLKKIYPSENGGPGTLAVEDFNIDIQDGEFIVLVGPSGCGKSTTLRMVAGLEEISDGKALLIDNDGEKDVTNLAAKDRDMAMVFQNYALYAHMTIYQNMAFSLVLRKEKAEVIHEKVMYASDVLGLDSQLNKKPAALSGGQRQRVAVGRAIVRNPKVFLFDEPLSNLDAKLRGSMRRELKLLHKRLGATIIYVTHDQIEALTLANRIVVMSMGKVQQIGTPLEIYSNPKNMFVASFIGNPPMNLIHGIVNDEGIFNGYIINEDKTTTESNSFKLPEKSLELLRNTNYINKDIVIGFRPEHCYEGGNIETKVELLEHLGQSTLFHCLLGKDKIIVKLPGWLEVETGTTLNISLNEDVICFFDAKTEERII